MGAYLIPYEPDRLRDLDGYDAINAALFGAGLGSLDSYGECDGFEEKLSPSMSSFEALVRQVVDPDQLPELPRVPGTEVSGFPAFQADLWIPAPFTGLLIIPGVAGIYNSAMTLASAVQIAAQCSALAEVIEFPRDIVPPLDPSGYVINDWRDQLVASADSNARIWMRDPDVAFYLALFGAVAEYSISQNVVVGYC